MKYIIKQKFFKIYRESFFIYDEQGNQVYKVKPKVSIFQKYTIEDMEKNSIMTITKKFFHIMPKYYIRNPQKELIAFAKKKFSFKPKYEIEHRDEARLYTIDGDILGFNFNIMLNNLTIASVYKKIIAMRDVYEIDVLDENESKICLALTLILDHVHHRRKNKLSNFSNI